MIVDGILVIVYLMAAALNAGAMLAWLQGSFVYNTAFNRKSWRSDLSFSWGISVIPLTWLITLFCTGFYEHGWMKLWGRNPYKSGKLSS